MDVAEIAKAQAVRARAAAPAYAAAARAQAAVALDKVQQYVDSPVTSSPKRPGILSKQVMDLEGDVKNRYNTDDIDGQEDDDLSELL